MIFIHHPTSSRSHNVIMLLDTKSPLETKVWIEKATLVWIGKRTPSFGYKSNTYWRGEGIHYAPHGKQLWLFRLWHMIQHTVHLKLSIVVQLSWWKLLFHSGSASAGETLVQDLSSRHSPLPGMEYSIPWCAALMFFWFSVCFFCFLFFSHHCSNPTHPTMDRAHKVFFLVVLST